MQHPLLDFLSTSLIPELSTDITAGTASYIQLGLVGIAAVRAFPYQLTVLVSFDLDLSVIAAHLTVIALGASQ